jgi:hypothetical protein
MSITPVTSTSPAPDCASVLRCNSSSRYTPSNSGSSCGGYSTTASIPFRRSGTASVLQDFVLTPKSTPVKRGGTKYAADAAGPKSPPLAPRDITALLLTRPSESIRKCSLDAHCRGASRCGGKCGSNCVSEPQSPVVAAPPGKLPGYVVASRSSSLISSLLPEHLFTLEEDHDTDAVAVGETPSNADPSASTAPSSPAAGTR